MSRAKSPPLEAQRSKPCLQENILVVDDSPDSLHLLVGILSRQGYKVRPAPDGELALRSVQSTLPDLILLDIMMPEINGYQVCQQLKATSRTQNIPVIFISALQEVFDKIKAFEVGGVDYITKPFQVQEVLARVENQLRIRRLSKQLVEQNTQLIEEIEERRRVEAALRQSEATNQAIISAIPDLLVRMSYDGTYLGFANRGNFDLFKPETTFIGAKIDNVLPPDIAQKRMEHVQQTLQTGELQVYDHQLVIEGETRYEETRIAKSGDGEVLLMVRDITERKQAEQALRQQKELLQTIFDHIPVMVALYDGNGQIQLVNRQLQHVLGWSDTELKDLDLLTQCYPDPDYRQMVIAHMNAATGKWQDFTTRMRGGSYIDTAWAFIRLSNGTSIGIGQDITERKQAEEASLLEERNRMAREIHDTLAQAFTGIIVHLGAASRVVTAEPQAAIAHITQVRNLAREGLTEARRSVEALRPRLLEDGDLCSALNRLTLQLNSFTDTRIVFNVVGNAYPLPSDVENNLLRIGQEALTNVVKHAHASEIQIELVYEPVRCVLRVRDNGQGFEIGRMPCDNGFGLLGMSERADRIGAQLTIQSLHGQGTEVVVTVNRE